jgi:hypothetical protein
MMINAFGRSDAELCWCQMYWQQSHAAIWLFQQYSGDSHVAYTDVEQ